MLFALLLSAIAALAAATPAKADVKVVATIKPIHALVAGVMDGIGSPELLVTGSASPHTFALKPSGARALNEAAVVFGVSPAVEPFTVKIFASLPKSVRIVTLSEAAGVQHLAARSGATFEAHDHADHASHEHDAAEHGASDGHVWLDPRNAKAMVDQIARVLGETSPGDAARLGANATRVKAEIDAMDQEIAGTLAPVKTRPYVVFHDAYQYFEHHYGLSPAGAITVGPDIQPGAKRLGEIRRKIGDLAAVCVFAEPQYSSSVMRAVTDGTSARFGTLDPEGALVEPGPGAYAALMRNLATKLRGCLEGTPSEGG
ncbi:MAG: zinc ABC transporter substrate-binding protein [Hyphomicrobiaceae bacterium]|nr:zinc ABC transporter substrate-binding protein [Hyphomicrobiaceae bacterium]